MWQVIYVVGVLKKRPRMPESCPPFLRVLITDCWQEEPEARPLFNIIHWQLQVPCLFMPQHCICAAAGGGSCRSSSPHYLPIFRMNCAFAWLCLLATRVCKSFKPVVLCVTEPDLLQEELAALK